MADRAERSGRYRYGEYLGGPDPLEPPYDVRGAVDALGESVLGGDDPASALRDLLRRGLSSHRGLDDMLRRVRERQRELRRSGRLDGILEQARALLDTAIGQERAELFPDPSDDARMREAELDSLPSDTAGAIRQLSDYQWRSQAAAQTFEQLKELLKREVLDSQFRGIKEQMSQPDPEGMQRIRDMMSALTDMIQADARGEHTQEDFDAFMASYGDFFPDSPENLEQLIDSLVRRMAAAQRLLNSLSDEQRSELAGLMAQAMEDAGLAQEMARLADALRARRPDVDWDGQRGERMTGRDPLGLGDATTALAELADLSELEDALRQDYPGARLDDIDEEAVRRALGRRAVDDMEALKQIERELQRQGYLVNNEGKLELTPKAVRRLGDTALRQVFAKLAEGSYGDHDQHDAGQAGELTGSTRPWRFGDEQAIDTAATVRNALLRGGVPGPAANATEGGTRTAVKLSVGDFEIGETERRASAAVCLLVDLSYSMALRGTWAAAKQTALALYSLVRTRFPQDSLQVIGFSDYARELREAELAGLGWDMVQGTNLQHALLLAGRFLERRPEDDPIVLIITDGEPTAHLLRNGRPYFDWPPSPETLELTMAEVDKMTRRRATLNIFMLADDERLTSFVDEVARRNGGRVLRAMPDSLGEYVVSDFLRSRRERQR
ncbi:MAG TPA: hypothetical protein VHJ18_31295 [Streptosporangiaceae bacterium]|nr:hypothetical protein [Streptosporangiaceae bacterium]